MKPARTGLHELQSDDRGTAILELAVVLPVLLTIGLGVLEFGNLIYRKHLIINGVRDAARYASGLPYDSANTSQTAVTITKAKNIATTGQISGGSNRVSWWTSSNVTVTYSTVANTNTCGSGGASACYRFDGAVPLVTVSTTVNYQPLGFLGFLGLSSVALSSSHEERVIGGR